MTKAVGIFLITIFFIMGLVIGGGTVYMYVLKTVPKPTTEENDREEEDEDSDEEEVSEEGRRTGFAGETINYSFSYPTNIGEPKAEEDSEGCIDGGMREIVDFSNDSLKTRIYVTKGICDGFGGGGYETIDEETVTSDSGIKFDVMLIQAYKEEVGGELGDEYSMIADSSESINGYHVYVIGDFIPKSEFDSKYEGIKVVLESFEIADAE